MGILDRIRESRERKFAEKREKAWNKTLQWLKKEYNKGLKKIARTPIEFNVSQNGILSRIATKKGIRIASYTVMAPYPGQIKEHPLMFPMACICGTFIERPIPNSMFVKGVRVGLRKDRFFLPYTATPAFSAKKVYKEKLNWNPLVELLNQDKKLRGLLKDLPTKTTVVVEKMRKGTINNVYKVNDKDDNYNTVCQVIPFKDKSLIATYHMMDEPKRIENAVKAIGRIREHIIEYGYDQPTTGQIPQPWASTIVAFLSEKG